MQPSLAKQAVRAGAILRHVAPPCSTLGRFQHQQTATCATAGPQAAGSAPTAGPQPQQQDQGVRQQELQQQWHEQSDVYYSNYPLNRAADQRRDEAQLQQWFNAPNTRVTPVMGQKVLLHSSSGVGSSSSSNGSNSSSSGTPSRYTPVWVSPAADLGAALSSDTMAPLFLGLDASNTPHFAVQVTADAAEQLAAQHSTARWVAARTAGPDMSHGDASLMAVAAGLAQWNLDTQFHGSSGAKTTPQDGGFSRRCSSSGRVLYPRIDPAIITLVTCGPDWCLLGRKQDWPTGRYSTLAGFLELGETLEQALCREVLEESGVAADLHSARYVASQPWPFPRSLMVGFYADSVPVGLAGTDWLSHEGRMAMMDTGLRPAEAAVAVQGLRLQQPTPQEAEMEDVRWFNREWLQWALQQDQTAAPQPFFIPGEYSLAYRLITGWLHNTGSSGARSGSSGGRSGGSNGSTSGSSGGSSDNANGSSSGGSTSGSSSSAAWVGDQVPQVDIDSGAFKYVLLRLSDKTDSSRSKLLVRGSAAAAYHNHVLQHTKAQVEQLAPGQLEVQVLGGGRIEHYREQQVASVYGYSAAFGPAVHEVTAGLLKKWMPFTNITWSYEGY